MAALPYIQLYVADYLSDAAHLTTIQHGAYLLLIFNYWQRGQFLNNANGRLAVVARMSNEEWQEHVPVLSEFFRIEGDEWHHERIDADLEAIAQKSEQARAAGIASGNNRRAKGKRTSNARSTVAQRTMNHTDTDTDTDTDTSIEHASRFDEFWATYPVKKGRAAAEKTWASKNLDSIADTIIADVKQRLTSDRQWIDGYIPHGSTYVNGRGWEDSIEAPRGKSAEHVPDYLVGAI
jgi:uncharacterized protein YdaU (DUF1376 family)